MRRNPVAPVAELLLEPGEVRLDKVLASKDHPVGEVSNPTKQALGQRDFPILLFNDTLSSSQVKGRRLFALVELPLTKRCLRYSRLSSFQEIVSGWPRMVLMP